MGRILSTLVLLSAMVPCAVAQLLDKRGEPVIPYYISFDALASMQVEDVRGEFLHVSYRDQIGRSETIKFVVYTASMELVRELKLVKEFGENYFNIRLTDHGIILLEGESYLIRMTNENFEVRERMIRFSPKVKNDITASIVVKPKYLSCEGKPGETNMVEFYGQIAGGKAPYKANWYVLNARRNDLLYEPSHVVVPTPGETSSIQVDKNPEYYVLLYITDACGNEQTATVQVLCQKNEKKVNTLFLQKLDDALLKKVENLK